MKNIGLFLLLVVPFLLITACTMKEENTSEEAKQLATKEFDLVSVYVVSAGTSASEIMSETTKRYPIYVLGISEENEEVFIVVPVLKSQKAYKIDWPFNKVFTEIIDELNSSEKGTICHNEDFNEINFVDSTEIMLDYYQELEIEELDFLL